MLHANAELMCPAGVDHLHEGPLTILVHVQVVLSKRATYDVSLLDSICVALSQAGLYERAGELYEQQRRFTEAQMAYTRCVTLSAAFTAASGSHS